MASETPDEPTDFETAAMPFLTLVSSLVVLLIFGIAGVMIYTELQKEITASNVTVPEEALRSMREGQQELLSRSGYDPTTKTSFIPITTAMELIVKSKGKTK